MRFQLVKTRSPLLPRLEGFRPEVIRHIAVAFGSLRMGSIPSGLVPRNYDEVR